MKSWSRFLRSNRALCHTRAVRGLVAVASVAVVAALAASASAVADSQELIGQTASSSTGSCGLCTVLQFEDSGTPTTYEVPSDGVLTRFLVYVGSEINASDWVQVRTFRRLGPSSAKVMSEGGQHLLSGSTGGVPNAFYDRVPAKAGDVLGARFDIFAHSVDATPPSFSTGSPSDSFAYQLVTDPADGDTFSPAFGSQYRANVAAWLEPDADNDGYGDVSQDLCPGSPIATAACSGALFGSRLQGAPQFRGACGYECMRVQKTVNGVSTAAPVDGVVVRWRVLNATAGSYRIRILGPAGGTKYTVLKSSAPEAVGADGSNAIKSFQSRLSIPAGGYVALVPPPFAGPQDLLDAPGATYQQINDGAEGSGGDFSGYSGGPGEALYNADIEPDADHDGYGDVTQDSCPGSAQVHEGPCPPSPPSGEPPSGRAPSIAGLKLAPKRFRVKRRSAGGANLKLTLSEPASVAFTVEAKRSCGASKSGRRCKASYWKRYSFSRALPAGASTLAFSGQYKLSDKHRSLPPGIYRVTAVATDSDGKTSSPDHATFAIVA